MKITITLNDTLFKQLKQRAADTGETISALVEDAIKYQLLEDIEDMEAAKKRASEPTISHADFIKELKADDLL